MGGVIVTGVHMGVCRGWLKCSVEWLHAFLCISTGCFPISKWMCQQIRKPPHYLRGACLGGSYCLTVPKRVVPRGLDFMDLFLKMVLGIVLLLTAFNFTSKNMKKRVSLKEILASRITKDRISVKGSSLH